MYVKFQVFVGVPRWICIPSNCVHLGYACCTTWTGLTHKTSFDYYRYVFNILSLLGLYSLLFTFI